MITMPAPKHDGRSSMNVPPAEPWISAASLVFEEIKPLLAGFMYANVVQLFQLEMLVAAKRRSGGPWQDQTKHQDSDPASQTPGPSMLHMMAGWLPLHQILSDEHGPIELWPVGDEYSFENTDEYTLRLGPQLRPGDMLFHNYAIWHRGSANHEYSDREVLIFNFCSGDCSSPHPLIPEDTSWADMFRTVSSGTNDKV